MWLDAIGVTKLSSKVRHATTLNLVESFSDVEGLVIPKRG